MKRSLPFIIALLSLASVSHGRTNAWRSLPQQAIATTGERKLFPQQYKLYQMDIPSLKAELATLSDEESEAREVQIPTPDGGTRTFLVWETPVMEKALADKYPEIKTYSGYAVDDRTATIKLDYTLFGFHALVYDNANTYFIDPYSTVDDGNYLCYYKHDYRRVNGSDYAPCVVSDAAEDELQKGRLSLTKNGLPNNTALKSYGTSKRTYRLAMACTTEYSAAVGGTNPTKSSVLSAITTTMNRVNGIYLKEVAMEMQLIANTDQLIYISPQTDPYSNNSGTAMLAQNQTNIDNVIGNANYDIGHVFSTGGGGIADLGCVCLAGIKARGVTGQPHPIGDAFDLDFVAHEMGHQYGGTHTFNANTGSCAGNGEQATAFEPGSGSTLMAYAGICGPANDLQAHSNSYFHSMSLEQLTDFLLDGGTGGSCGSATSTGNVPPAVPSFAQTYNIPCFTPFELTAPEASDNTHNLITYSWEEVDLGDFGVSFAQQQYGPILRSFDPANSRTRIFPTLDKLLQNITNYLGEKLPEVNRTLTFDLTVRDVYNGVGSFNTPNDRITLNAVNTGAPFAVTSPNTAAAYWQMGSNVTVTWDVASTTGSPINCSAVDISLSLDGGQNFTVVLAAGTPNDGTETITVPNGTNTNTARVKVKGVGNVFFDLSNADFKINNWPASVPDQTAGAFKAYPVPAKDVLHLEFADDMESQVSITNTLGQQVWQGNVKSKADISVGSWGAGVYYLKYKDASGNDAARSIVVQ